jgi:hypothetical protein
MSREQYYLCRVPSYGIVVLYPEKDYKYQRHHEANLRVPNPENAIVLLAHGAKREMDLLYNLAIERSN